MCHYNHETGGFEEMRKSNASRKTLETDIDVETDLDGEGRTNIKCDIPFLKHMIKTLATHSLIDVKVSATGDLRHHVTEDTALCIGESMNKALGDRSGLRRFGCAMVPMDGCLASAAVDLARRPQAVIELKVEGESIEDMPREDILHFLSSLAISMEATIHVQVNYGDNDHHKVEAGLKALAISLRQAVALDERRVGVPSAKGIA
jgi:imidazoleglycerol-phosphate dehydratase